MTVHKQRAVALAHEGLYKEAGAASGVAYVGGRAAGSFSGGGLRRWLAKVRTAFESGREASKAKRYAKDIGLTGDQAKALVAERMQAVKDRRLEFDNPNLFKHQQELKAAERLREAEEAGEKHRKGMLSNEALTAVAVPTLVGGGGLFGGMAIERKRASGGKAG